MTARIDEVLQAAVDAGAAPGVVATAAGPDGVLYEGAAGKRSAAADDPITPDTMMRIASMTKMVTTTAALQLIERGSLSLDAPVREYRPEFADLPVLTGFDGDTPRLRAPSVEATVRHLITHTAGFGYWIWDADIDHYEQITGIANVMPGTIDVFKAPMVFDPGTRFEYGISVDWLGQVIEAVSGLPLDAYFLEHITGPLGMTNTTARMTPEQRANSTPIHVRGEDGAWVATDVDWAQQPDYWGGGHFLYSTPRDFLKLQQMLLGCGTLGDVQVLDRATVAAAFANQIGALDFPATITTAHPELSDDVTLGPGLKWGFGLMLNPAPFPGMRAAGSGSWSGLFNTHFWVDPASGVSGAIYSQTLPFVDAPAVALYAGFERALYASL